MSSVTFDHVRKLYGETVAVEDITLDIADGEFVSILGPSGSGKSTALRMIAGLEDISGGEIRIGDRVINDVPSRDRGVAMVFQNYALYPHMTVRDNMSYGLRLTTDLSKAEIAERVDETAEMLGIADYLERKPSGLSGGQQQRVATGRAIVREPEVFLMDEPLSNLDAKLKMHMRTELQRIHEELGTTTVYVTHDQEEAMTMSDRIVIIANGRVQQVGTPDDIYNRPRNRFVAEFIGSPSMNLYEVEWDGHALSGDGFSVDVDGALLETVGVASPGSEYDLGVRPEDVVVCDDGEEGIDATVDVVEPVGSDNYLFLDIGGQQCTARVSAQMNPAVGDDIRVRFDTAKLHLFDVETEENVLTESDATTEGGAESAADA